ncbi:tetratricopeptide repeat protein 28-like [Stylophora pistillata]|uniref:tetratricopeptide repeat protein 28-like n=1 Tax=Stylophora pistillata TaxID=50429 RepID=UPI000C055B05|nr:tetratricopeptide repeat protein 28-like [Stylophora pistillata]
MAVISVSSYFIKTLDDLFNKTFRSFGVLPRELCEDRSLDDIDKHDDSLAQRNETEDTDRYLQMFYKLIIAPVANLLTGPEVIIVPERSMYRVPFAALREETGKKFLTENLRIRIAPSLMTLKLIQDSPPNYHSQTGALIVGDPVVGEVLYRGARKNITELPCARKEAEMVGQLMGVEPLIGERATKQAVLDGIDKASLIHIAAHGNAERGQIALAPNRTTEGTGFPKEEDYLLTMEDISQVQLRAKLVVLSCCHSGKGQIGYEGVVGIARAFLGSGARSVLVAGWALEDRATEQLMNQFYKHLAGGESASESLHQAMKWMRNNRFTKVSQWAPFMLIGDDVKIDFKGEAKKTPPAKD